MISTKTIRRLVSGIALVLVLLLALGFAGKTLAIGNALALLRPQLGVLLLTLSPVLFALNARAIGAASILLAIIASATTWPGFLTTTRACPGDCLTLYQKNLLSNGTARAELVRDVLASGAEIVTLQEASDHNRREMPGLFAHYPFGVICNIRPRQDVGVLTSLPVIEGSEFCQPDAALAGIQVIVPDGRPVWILSIHLDWPYPRDQLGQSRRAAALIDGLDGLKLIGGDFNMVPWGGSVARIEAGAQLRPLGPFMNTHQVGNWLLPLPIDLVLVPQGSVGSIERRPQLGSDHFGLLARIGLPKAN
ncbi:MAG: endonuclease/exonuclease/phosphatase family protein [Pseudomonadota bacterium]